VTTAYNHWWTGRSQDGQKPYLESSVLISTHAPTHVFCIVLYLSIFHVSYLVHMRYLPNWWSSQNYCLL